MTLFDQIVLLLTGLIAIYMIWFFVKRQKSAENNGVTNIYYIISFTVFLVAGLLLIIFGWGALSNKLVAVVSGLIPFALATGLIAKYYPKMEKGYLALMLFGLVLITLTKYGDMIVMGKIVYPLFHSIAGLTIFFVPILVVKATKISTPFINITVGGTLIGLGGIALGFLSAGSQLLFFSQEFVLMILAPLLFLTALFFALGFIKGIDLG
ncbi:MAG: hypothetical protein D8M58_18300 [Calditrichaeota bacterium]|nr:MAG: hypothetical protein DWQ03_11530 [Calditrichota bacterium]MBL1207362.1 hypothetical protein [Calditrichota bacterium]NOG47194.1 hypothetical protein [Calditrichota bacterium]